ncbi:hypothetical protein NGC65_13305 [Staphylococcus xylosus]|uniref:hypothetical protein n=1 Tax=Staphylococcus xylosus TaxID=1288 RepID=UPI002DBB4E40|nr:hypothetical protein [Staphylococcus xylosus]MEB7823340.1 hypothetical protein [Staphylococcus xylosus]MEB7866407.1 hypothetical protein [Staphylococcus xylosus]
MNIVLDDNPKTTVPSEVTDYSSLLLCSFLHQPLFLKKNGFFLENIVFDKSIEKEIILEFKELYWSNGELLVVEDFKNTLLYIIKSRSYLSNYLSFIEGVEEYLSDECILDDIGIYTKDKTLHIKSKVNSDYYKYVFSTIYFSPVKIENGNICKDITCGKYCIKNNSYELIPNSYNRTSINENVNFIVNKHPCQNITGFLEGNIDLTATTLIYKEDKEKLLNFKEFNSKVSNLLLRVEMRKNIHFIKQELSEFLSEFIISDYYLSDDIKVINNNISNEVSQHTLMPQQCIKVLYADYYPNNIIADEIEKFLKEKHVEVAMVKGDFDYFLKEYNNPNYNIVIDIVSSITNSNIDYLIEKMKYIDDQYIDQYIDAINAWSDNSIKINKLYEFINEYSSIIEIGYLKHNYLLKKKYEDKIFIDDNDNLIIN